MYLKLATSRLDNHYLKILAHNLPLKIHKTQREILFCAKNTGRSEKHFYRREYLI